MTTLRTDDRKQTIRMRRFLMAAASYGLWTVLSVVLYHAGFLHVRGSSVPWLVAGVVATNLVFFALLKSGLNLRLKDPSLTTAQILTALLWVLSLMFMAAESRGVMLTIYLITMLFGVFRLSMRQFAQLATFAFVGYLGVVVIENLVYPQRTNYAREIINIIVLSGALAWTVLFGSYIGGLRQTLRERNSDLKDAVREFSQLALHDPLTDSFNRRYIMQNLHDEKVRADRTGSPFSVAIMDLDHFKKINDRFGHLTGDSVLKSFAQLVRDEIAALREEGAGDGLESFARYGGEEFVMVMPHTPLARALTHCERIRRATFEASFDDVFRITVSIGVAEYRPGERFEETLRRADHAMYQAKDEGRDRVAAYEEDGTDTGGSGKFRAKVLTGRFRALVNPAPDS